MQPLSQVLENIQNMSPEKTTNISNTQQHGSIAAVGTTNISPETYLGLQDLAKEISKGKPLDDHTLRTLLEQHFGSRLAVKKLIEPVYDKPGGYDEEFKGYQVSLDRLDDSEMKFFDALDFFNKRASFEYITGKVAKMRIVMARRNESNQDIEMLCAAYVEHLQKYPPDVVNHVVENVIQTKKFFPLVSELIPALEELTALRQGVLKEFERVRSPLYQKRIA